MVRDRRLVHYRKILQVAFLGLLLVNLQGVPAQTYPITHNYTNSEGSVTSFEEQFSGSYVLLDAMATWCGPCRVEMVHLQEVYDVIKDNSNITMISMSMDPESDTIEKVEDFMGDFDAKWQYGLDHSGNLSSLLNVQYYPTTFLLDPEGEVVKKWVGLTESDVLLKELDKHLELPGEFVRQFNVDAFVDNLFGSFYFYIFMIMIWMFIIYSGFVFIQKITQKKQSNQDQ